MYDFIVRINRVIVSSHKTVRQAALAASKEYKRLERHCKTNPQDSWKLDTVAVYGPDGKIVAD